MRNWQWFNSEVKVDEMVSRFDISVTSGLCSRSWGHVIDLFPGLETSWKLRIASCACILHI